MDFFESIILAFVQGITEFLPVSSSGHVAIASKLLGFGSVSIGFEAALHIGTLLAVIAYFWRDWIDIFRSAFYRVDVQDAQYTKTTLWLLALATIPAAVAGYFLKSIFEGWNWNSIFIAIGIFAGAILLWIADKCVRGDRDIAKLAFGAAVLIGMAQAIALLPGISRSGVTIAAAMLLGFGRKEAARLSFLLATPITFGAGLLVLPDLFSGGFSWAILTGIAVSFITGYLTIEGMLRFVERLRYGVFVWYSFALVAALIALRVFFV